LKGAKTEFARIFAVDQSVVLSVALHQGAKKSFIATLFQDFLAFHRPDNVHQSS
jgi:hypothetical protein